MDKAQLILRNTAQRFAEYENAIAELQSQLIQASERIQKLTEKLDSLESDGSEPDSSA